MCARRRDEYAEQTRRDVSHSARELFAAKGYFATTVVDIADASRVSPGTVYQQCGGKRGLLLELVGTLVTPRRSFDAIGATGDLADAVRALTESYLDCWRDIGDLVQLAVQTSPHDDAVARALVDATAHHRAELRSVAGRLGERGVLPDAWSGDDFADIALYHYGPQSGFHVTVAVLGWSVDRAAAFIALQFTRALAAEAPAPEADTSGTADGSRSSGSARCPSSR